MAATRSEGFPSRRAIAFALSLVRSKPAELPIAEYIDLLRQHIAKGRRENALSSAYHHLDRSSYWRAENERTKDALQTAESENVDLRREIVMLKAKAESAKVAQPKKRKRPDGDVIPYLRSPKKARQDTPAPSRSLQVQPFEADFDFADVGEAGNVLMGGVHQVHAALKAHNKTEVQPLVQGLLQAAKALPQVIIAALKFQVPEGRSQPDHIKPVLLAAGRSFQALIAGFTRLSKIDTGATVLGHVTYALVQMYGKLTECISTLSAVELRGKPDPVVKGSSPSKPNSKSAKVLMMQGGPTLDLFTKFLIGCIDELDPSTDKTQGLFEGFAYVVLNLLGSRLYLVVFGRPRGDTIEDEIMACASSDDVDHSDTIALESPDDFKRRAARLEAPYLIHLLERIMTATPAYLGAAINAKMTKRKSSSPKGVLAVAAKERLQRTLVNCIFGSNEADENDLFNDCLKMPTIPATPLPHPKIKDVDVEAWFKEEMWRLLGWEILSSEGDW